MKACLVVAGGVHQGKTIPIPGAQFLIGRDETCHLRPSSPNISNKHCILFLTGDRVTVVDLGSTNGTFVNGTEVSGETLLTSGDVLKVGPLEFFVNFKAGVESSTHKPIKPAGKATMNIMEADAQEDRSTGATTTSKPKTMVGTGSKHPKTLTSPPKTSSGAKSSNGTVGPRTVVAPITGSSRTGTPPKTLHGAKTGGKPPEKRPTEKTIPVLDLPPEEPEGELHTDMETEDPVVSRPDGTTLVLNLDGDTSTNPSVVPEGTTVTDIPIVSQEDIEEAKTKVANAKVGLSSNPINKPKVNTSNTLDTSVVAMSILNKYSMMRGKKPPTQQ